MSIPLPHPDKNAVRVCTHKWAFVTARTYSLGVGRLEKTIPYFSWSDIITLLKYNRQADHHALILRIVLSSTHTSAVLPSMIRSMLRALCLL